MEHLTPNTRTTPDRGADHTVQPIQAIFAARFVGKKFGYRHHSVVRKAVGIGLLANLSESNRTNPKPTISRSPRAERLQEPDIFSTPPHLQSEQTQTPLAAAYRATQAEAPPDQHAVAELHSVGLRPDRGEVRFTEVYEVRDERITACHVYIDPEDLPA